MGVRLLDITRSLRRADRLPTGIDRVERAYLEQFLQDPDPVFGLCRTPFGYLILDRAGLQDFQNRLTGVLPWRRPDVLSRLTGPRERAVRSAETGLRREAIARSSRHRLPRILAGYLPKEFAYFNVGHSNLTQRVLAAIKAQGGEANVLIHDVIPLELPQFQRPGTPEKFRQKIDVVARLADRVIFNSEASKRAAAPFFEGDNFEPVVAHLGVTPALPNVQDIPNNLDLSQPYFLTVGTIEPRKNHRFLLDLWAQMGPGAPQLLICGKRGWNNEDVFARLDQLPPDGPIKELPDLSDAAIAALAQNTCAALFPSLAEGFGLPPVECAILGSRILCNDLEIMREVLGEHATKAPISDAHFWLNKIAEFMDIPPPAGKLNEFAGPTWADHFKTVLRLR